MGKSLEIDMKDLEKTLHRINRRSNPEPFTSGIVTANQRRYYLSLHPEAGNMFQYQGAGKYKMTGWKSQIDRARWVK